MGISVRGYRTRSGKRVRSYVRPGTGRPHRSRPASSFSSAGSGLSGNVAFGGIRLKKQSRISGSNGFNF